MAMPSLRSEGPSINQAGSSLQLSIAEYGFSGLTPNTPRRPFILLQNATLDVEHDNVKTRSRVISCRHS
ncbi:MAG: hypothetical protein EWM72_02047 [Nitrospira sp.]|nr:MAG: hypothetical protein EWM72_02047 [Nitrospira sp.]